MCKETGGNLYLSSKIPVVSGTKYVFHMIAYWGGRVFSGEWREIIVGDCLIHLLFHMN
ncbi:hypothetical protein JGI16_11701 [Candidatus Kryptonium thompsonii]|nr:hypothetical protein JGI16_11701 [Candidatus Kryptonium thompsoni]